MECEAADNNPSLMNPKTKACCTELNLPCKLNNILGQNSCITKTDEDTKLEDAMKKCCQNQGANFYRTFGADDAEYKEACK